MRARVAAARQEREAARLSEMQESTMGHAKGREHQRSESAVSGLDCDSGRDETTPSQAFRVADLFCGAGGMSEGFRQAGCRILVGSDIDPDACATYALN